MSHLWKYKSIDCEHHNSCIKSILIKFFKNAGYAIAIKFFLRLITERKPLYLL